MTLKKMRPAVLVCTVLVSTLTTATIFAAEKEALSDANFANLAVIPKGNAATFGTAADKSAVTKANGIDSLMGKDAQPLKVKQSGFYRMMEVKYENSTKQTSSVQVIEFRNNYKAEAYLVRAVPEGAKFKANGTGFKKGNLTVTRVGGMVVRINGANDKVSKILASRYRQRITAKYKQINKSPYVLKPASNSLKLAAAAGRIKSTSIAGIDGQIVKPVSAVNNIKDYVSFLGAKKKGVRVFVADFNAWKQSLSKKKLTKEESEVAGFLKNYVNRFRYYKTPKSGGYAIVGRYKGFILGIHRVKNGKSTATPKLLKAILEKHRINLFFGPNSKQKTGTKPANGAASDAEDSDESEESASDESADSGADEESEEGGSDSESDSEDTE